jgi:hypothetical protein
MRAKQRVLDEIRAELAIVRERGRKSQQGVELRRGELLERQPRHRHQAASPTPTHYPLGNTSGVV